MMAQRRRDKGPGQRRMKHVDMSRPLPRITEDELCSLVEETEDALILILDGVEDPHNLGACMRSADAAGVLAVVAPRNHAAPMTDTVRRIAAGGADHVPFIQVKNLVHLMKKLQDAGMWFVGTSDANSKPIYDVEMTGRTGIVLGAEDKGMRKLTSETCDHLVTIPMTGHVDCLNVSVATGVCLFEVVRQRTAG